MPRQSTCRHCEAVFTTKPSASRKFCSSSCYHAWQHGRSPYGEAWEETFWSRVNRSDDPDDCWLWTGRPSAWGYGRMMINGERMPTHRLAWELTNGPIPDGLLACHHCDTPLCCNPSHLFLGTNADNMHDMAAKGRWDGPRGETTATSKLTAEQVLEIRARYRPYEVMQKDLAAEYGVTASCIKSIVNRRSWRHL